MDDFKNIGRTINLKSSSAAKEEMTFLRKRKMASNHISGGNAFLRASLRKETLAEYMLGGAPGEVGQCLESLAYCRRSLCATVPPPFGSLLMSSQFF